MLEFHPLANLFPLIEGKAFEDLVADVKLNGLREDIVILDGMILDGRNRYRAGIEAGLIDPEAPAHDGTGMQDWCGLYLPEYQGDPLTWVLSKNLHRRHLNESQRASVAAKIETLTHGGDRTGRSSDSCGPDGHPPGQDANLHPAQPQIDRKTAADMLNVSTRSVASAHKVIEKGAPELVAKVDSGELAVSVAEKLADLSKEKQAEFVRTVETKKLKTVAKQVQRDATEKKLGDRQHALPTKLYGVILADPPWRFETYSRETGLDRAADNHYPTQELAEIKAECPIGTLAAPDCVLFLWTTVPMLAEAMKLLGFWGFRYVSNFDWRKDRAGTGYWSRNRHEHLLVAVKGNPPAPAPGTQFDSSIEAPVGAHSVKPDAFYEIIETYYPNLPRIELHARRRRDGWDAWGLEAPEDAETPVSRETPPDTPNTATPAANMLEGLTRLTAYRRLVAEDQHRGRHTKATAEPIVRAAYACDPIIPTKQLAADLGHPVGTALTWASRLGLTQTGRRDAHAQAFAAQQGGA